MINSVNSYSSYYNNYTSNNENSKTKILNNNSNLVNDKTQAVSKTLGYGVDSEGYFTSDFNEAAALPKDYKIYAKDIEYYADSIGKGNSIKDGFFTTMDIAKTIGNTYKIFSQLIDDENYINFSKEQLENIPKWFQYDFKNLKVNKIYQSENEFMNIEKSKNDRFMVETSLSFENNNFK
ncbi:MAG: hypothetical protein J1D99_06670, partial [Campylobacter sp.]|nr:hypothetical protein [Campylobacter sp.]